MLIKTTYGGVYVVFLNMKIFHYADDVFKLDTYSQGLMKQSLGPARISQTF